MNEITTAAPGRAIAPSPAPRAMVPTQQPRAIIPTTIEEVQRMAKIAVAAGYLQNTKGDSIAQAIMIIAKGLELGMTPTMALDSIALINGRFAVWGKAVAALVRSKGHRIREWETGTRMADDWTFHCEVTRGDTGEVITRSFSVLDAKQAGLWSQEARITRQSRDGPYTKDNDSPWFRFPQRMLPARAKGYAAADGAPEALLGMYTVEEMQDVVRAEEVQAEERGALMAAPPPPALLVEEPAAQDADGQDAIVESVGAPASGSQVDGASDQVADPASEAPDHPPSPKPNHIELAAVACAGAMAKAKTVKRLDDLMNAFGERFDGDIPRATATQLELIYEQNKARIEGAGKA